MAFANVSDSQIGSNDYHDVWQVLRDLSSQWESIGLSLGLKPSTIETIKADSGSKCEKCLREVISHWLKKNYDYKKHGNPSWRKVCIAVEEGGEDPALAEEIASQHSIRSLPAATSGATPLSTKPSGGPIPTEYDCKIAYEVLKENTFLIKESGIKLDDLATKMLEKGIINESDRKDIVDIRRGLPDSQRIDELLSTLRETVGKNGSIFGWFIQALRDNNTILSCNAADKLITLYNTAVKGKKTS